ncbi:hypothetical protein BKA82DRAFT_4017769 [Pisolithus tinctorius]|nr:hypothetical protein BKA82DRAFT_4017769 [Pisolithus tinctorius]
MCLDFRNGSIDLAELQPPVDRTLVPLQVVRQQKYQKTPAPKYKMNPGRKNVKGKGKVQEEGVADDSADDIWMITARLRGAMLEQMIPPLKRYLAGGKTVPRHHSLLVPAQIPHQLMVPIATSLNTNSDLHSGSEYTTELQDHSEYADADGLESIPFTDLPTEEGSTSRNKGGKLKSALKRTAQGKFGHVESVVMANKFALCVKSALSESTSANVKQGVPGSTWKSPRVRKAPARPDADVPSPDAKRSRKQTGSNQKQNEPIVVEYVHRTVPAKFVSIVKLPHVKQSKNLEERLVRLRELREPTLPPIVSSGRADMAGSNIDIAASLLAQFLQEREPTTLAEGGIAAVMDPHENLMNRFLNEREPTAPPADGMNAPPVTDEKLNRMDGSSTPAQDMTMQVDFLADLQNVRELSPLPITHESSNLRDPSPRPNSPTNLLAQLQDMREPTPPPSISNVPVESFDLTADEDNGGNHLTFGMPERSEMRDLFEEICNGELPSEQQSLQMEQWGLAPVPRCDQAVSRYRGNTTPSDTPFDPTLDRHLVHAANAIARELGTAARDQYGAASQGLRLINMLDLMEVVRWVSSTWHVRIEVASVHLKQTADIVGWPAHWFANLAMDLNQLNSLILVTAPSSRIGPLHTADPNSALHSLGGYIVPRNMQLDSQRLQGKGLFSAAWVFFKLMMAQGLWPLPEAPIADLSRWPYRGAVFDANPLALSTCPIYDV